MAQLEGKYEVVMVLSMAAGEEKQKALYERFHGIIANNGTVDSVDEWGSKKLAYPINHETEGYYYLVNFTAKPDFPAELDRLFRITDGFLRTMMVAKVDKPIKGKKAKRQIKIAAAKSAATAAREAVTKEKETVLETE